MEEAKRRWGEVSLVGADMSGLIAMVPAVKTSRSGIKLRQRLTKPKVTDTHRRAKRKAQREARRRQR